MTNNDEEKGKSTGPLDRNEPLKTTAQTSVDSLATAGGEKPRVDEAYEYLRQHADLVGEQGVDLQRVRRKVDYRILPLMFCIFGLQFLDKSLLNYAIVMGLPEDMSLKGNQLNHIASSLWWSYLAVTPLVALIINKAPLGKWLGANMFIWGIIIACTAAVKTYPQYITLRILMGVFDAGIPPSLMLLSSRYYRKDEQAARFAIWFCSVGVAIVLGGLISFGFQHVHTESLESWRIMFLALGIISLLVGALCFWSMPDSPMNAKFLSDAEKTALIHHISVNQTGISGSKFEWQQVRELFIDPQIYLLVFLSILIAGGTGILGTYTTTIIKSFGFTSKQAALLTMPGGVIAIITTLGAACIVRYHILSRWALALMGYALSLVGGCMVAFAPAHNHAAQLVGIYMVSFSIFTSGIKYQWISANVAGHTKRSLATALMSAATSVGLILAPYAIQKKDRPRFQTGKDVLVSTKASATVVLVALGLYYLFVNKRRDRLYGKPPSSVTNGTGPMPSSYDSPSLSTSTPAAPSSPALSSDALPAEEVWANITDKQRKSFRYVY